MPTDQRLEQLYSLYIQLDELTTADEMETYPFLTHLGDLIDDLRLEQEP
jgi:hypothetical protein